MCPGSRSKRSGSVNSTSEKAREPKKKGEREVTIELMLTIEPQLST